MRVIAISPAFDEESTIGEVVTDLVGRVDLVVVVDDGSSDATAERARAAGAFVVQLSPNQGVGSAVAAGLAEALRQGADVVIQVDGDGQHDAACIDDLLAGVRDGADLVVGTRFESGFEMSAVRRTVLRGFAWLLSVRIGVHVSDPTSGFRAFSAAAASRLAPIFPRTYLSDTVEVLFLADELGLAIATTPVRMRARQGGEASVGPLRGIGYTLRMLAIIVRHSVRLRRHGA